MAIKSKIKGKKKTTNKKTSKRYAMYKVDGDKVTRERCCPRCGPGIFLAGGLGRHYCGRCHFTEFDKKNVEPMLADKKEEKKEEKKAEDKK